MPSNRSARENSGGSLEMSLQVQIVNTSLSWSFSQVRNVPKSRAETPLSPGTRHAGQGLLHLVDEARRRAPWRR